MKPIFIVRAPSNVPSDNVKMVWEYLEEDIVNDYHPIVVYDNTVKEWTFELYNVQNATEIGIEELKKEVLTNIKSYE